MQAYARRWSPLLPALSLIACDCAAAERPVVLPIALQGNYPVLKVVVDGIEVPLIFDSGNSASVALTQTVLDRVKATPTGDTSRGMDAKGNVLVYPKYKLARVQIGAAIFTDVVADLDVHDPSYQADQVGQQGFLGTSLLKRYKVVIDYPHRRISLVPPGDSTGRTSECRGSVVPFSPEWHGEPAAEMSTDVGWAVVWWDTGTPTSLLSRKFIQARGLPSSGDTLTSKHLWLGGADFGPWRFDVWDVAFPPGFDGSIGYTFFAKHVVCMDFPNQRLLIQK
jgi:hypothetical protein